MLSDTPAQVHWAFPWLGMDVFLAQDGGLETRGLKYETSQHVYRSMKCALFPQILVAGTAREASPLRPGPTKARATSAGSSVKQKKQRTAAAARVPAARSNLGLPDKKPWQLLQAGAAFVHLVSPQLQQLAQTGLRCQQAQSSLSTSSFRVCINITKIVPSMEWQMACFSPFILQLHQSLSIAGEMQISKPPQQVSCVQEGFKPRDQILCDLIYFFNSVMRCYLPAINTGLVPSALMPAPRPEAVSISLIGSTDQQCATSGRCADPCCSYLP